MKAIIQFILFSLLIITGSSHGMKGSHTASGLSKKHVLVPLEGFLFEVNGKSALSELGGSGALSAVWTSGFRSSLKNAFNSVTGKAPDQKALAVRLFALLHEMHYEPSPAQEKTPCVYWQGLQSPHVLVHGWMQGKKKCEELQRLVLAHIADQAGRLERASLETSAQLIFDPEKNAHTMQANQDAISLLKALRAAGHTLHIVDNWNGEAYDCLTKQHEASFADINGHTHISGKIGAVKSADGDDLHASFFKEHRDIDPRHCVLIETEPNHVAPLKARQWEYVLCQEQNIAELRATLQRIGLLIQ